MVIRSHRYECTDWLRLFGTRSIWGKVCLLKLLNFHIVWLIISPLSPARPPSFSIFNAQGFLLEACNSRWRAGETRSCFFSSNQGNVKGPSPPAAKSASCLLAALFSQGLLCQPKASEALMKSRIHISIPSTVRR